MEEGAFLFLEVAEIMVWVLTGARPTSLTSLIEVSGVAACHRLLSYFQENSLTSRIIFLRNWLMDIQLNLQLFSYFLSSLPAIVFLTFYRVYLQLFFLLLSSLPAIVFLTFYRLYLQLFFLLFIESTCNCFS